MPAGENDVVTKAHASNTAINNGTAIVFTNAFGTSQSVNPSGQGGINVVQTSGEINAKLWYRFDDTTYYTA